MEALRGNKKKNAAKCKRAEVLNNCWRLEVVATRTVKDDVKDVKEYSPHKVPANVLNDSRMLLSGTKCFQIYASKTNVEDRVPE